LITELRNALEQTEASTRRPGMRTAVWVEKMAAENAEVPEETVAEETETPRRYMDPRILKRYFPGLRLVPDSALIDGRTGMLRMPWEQTQSGPRQESQPSTNKISSITLTCRGVSWNRLYPTADAELCYALLGNLLSSPMFLSGTNGTQLLPQYDHDEATGTFQFSIKLKLARPITL